MKVGGSSLSTLNRGEKTPENSIQAFEIIILQLLEWLGVEWSDYQLRETAELMSAEYHWMSLPELKAFTSRVKTGQYGKEWGKLRPLALMDWMGQWADELLQARASVHARSRKEPEPVDESKLVDPQLVFDTLKQCFGAKAEEEQGMSREQKEEIYRQEKIKQRQRDVLRNQQNPEE